MKRVLVGLILLINTGSAELNNVKYSKVLHSKTEDIAIKYVRDAIISKEIRDMIGMNIDPITTITNIYQDYDDRKNILYEYTINTKKASNINESMYDQFAIILWEQNLPNLCAVEDLRIAMNLGVGFRYIYLDSNEKIIADMTIKKKDCDNLK